MLLPAVLHTLLYPCISLSFMKFSSIFPSGTMLHFHTELLALHSCSKQPCLALKEIFCIFCIHPVTQICEFPYCFHFVTTSLPAPLPLRYSLHNSRTVSTLSQLLFLLHCLSDILFTIPVLFPLSHNFSSCSTASPTFSSQFPYCFHFVTTSLPAPLPLRYSLHNSRTVSTLSQLLFLLHSLFDILFTIPVLFPLSHNFPSYSTASSTFSSQFPYCFHFVTTSLPAPLPLRHSLHNSRTVSNLSQLLFLLHCLSDILFTISGLFPLCHKFSSCSTASLTFSSQFPDCFHFPTTSLPAPLPLRYYLHNSRTVSTLSQLLFLLHCLSDILFTIPVLFQLCHNLPSCSTASPTFSSQFPYCFHFVTTSLPAPLPLRYSLHNSRTVSTLSQLPFLFHCLSDILFTIPVQFPLCHNFSSCSTASPIFSSQFPYCFHFVTTSLPAPLPLRHSLHNSRTVSTFSQLLFLLHCLSDILFTIPVLFLLCHNFSSCSTASRYSLHNSRTVSTLSQLLFLLHCLFDILFTIPVLFPLSHNFPSYSTASSTFSSKFP